MHPADYRGRSMSVSDVVALKQSGVMSFHYVDSIEFWEIRNFMKEDRIKQRSENPFKTNEQQR